MTTALSCKDRLEAYLNEHGVFYQAQQHRKAFTAREIAASESLPAKLVAKVVMVFADNRKVMLVVPASYRVSLAQAAAVIGAHEIRLAHEDEFARDFPDCQVGAEPPLGNLYGLPVYVDQSLADDQVIVFPAGTYVDTISIPYEDFVRLVKPTVAQFAYPC